MTSTVVLWPVIIVVALTIIAVVLARRRTQSDAGSIVDGNELSRWEDDDGGAQMVEHDSPIRWATQVGAQAEMLDDEARLRLIADLGLIHAAWAVPILRQAFVEERREPHREAALLALAECADRDALAALASGAHLESADANHAGAVEALEKKLNAAMQPTDQFLRVNKARKNADCANQKPA